MGGGGGQRKGFERARGNERYEEGEKLLTISSARIPLRSSECNKASQFNPIS